MLKTATPKNAKKKLTPTDRLVLERMLRCIEVNSAREEFEKKYPFPEIPYLPLANMLQPKKGLYN